MILSQIQGVPKKMVHRDFFIQHMHQPVKDIGTLALHENMCLSRRGFNDYDWSVISQCKQYPSKIPSNKMARELMRGSMYVMGKKIYI